MTEDEWDKKFDEKFVEFAADGSEWGAGLRIKHTGTTEDREILDNIKSFIRDLIQDDRKHQKSETLKRLPSIGDMYNCFEVIWKRNYKIFHKGTNQENVDYSYAVAQEIHKLAEDKLK